MEPKNNSGALFTNNKREKETHPHYNGKATINGPEDYVSSWVSDKEGVSISDSWSAPGYVRSNLKVKKR